MRLQIRYLDYDLESLLGQPLPKDDPDSLWEDYKLKLPNNIIVNVTTLLVEDSVYITLTMGPSNIHTFSIGLTWNASTINTTKDELIFSHHNKMLLKINFLPHLYLTNIVEDRNV